MKLVGRPVTLLFKEGLEEVLKDEQFSGKVVLTNYEGRPVAKNVKASTSLYEGAPARFLLFS